MSYPAPLDFVIYSTKLANALRSSRPDPITTASSLSTKVSLSSMHAQWKLDVVVAADSLGLTGELRTEFYRMAGALPTATGS